MTTSLKYARDAAIADFRRSFDLDADSDDETAFGIGEFGLVVVTASRKAIVRRSGVRSRWAFQWYVNGVRLTESAAYAEAV